MPITHHPDPSTLMAFAAGSLPEALSVVVATHLSLCPVCRRDVRRLETVGASLLAGLAGAPLATTSAPNTDATGDLAVAARAQRAARRSDRSDDDTRVDDDGNLRDGAVPRPLHKFVGDNIDQIPWKRLGFGVWHYPLPLSPGAPGDLRLLKVSPGLAMPEHGHGGSELTLILRGCYRDEIGTFRAGDLADLDDDVEHRPLADPQNGCVCLIASETRARFKTLFGRMMQPLTGM